MPIYVIIPLTHEPDLLAETISQKIETTDRYTLPEGHGWLINYKGTTVELTSFLGIAGTDPAHPPEQFMPAFVSPVPTYYGLGSSDIWEWLATRASR